MFTVGRPPNLFELVCEGLMLSNEVTLDVSIAPLDEVTLLFCFWKGEKEDRFLLRVWNKSLRFLGLGLLAWLLGNSGSVSGSIPDGDNFLGGAGIILGDFDGLTSLILSKDEV